MATDLLMRISKLAQEQLRLEREISTLKEQLKSAEALHRQISETDLPEAMGAAEMEEFTMRDGRKISIKKTFHATIPSEKQGEAFDWLRKHGYDSIIKRTIVIEFGKGEDKKAQSLYNRISQYKNLKDNSVVGNQTVHHSTLKSFVRQAMEGGEDIPVEVFGIHVRTFAEIGAVKR